MMGNINLVSMLKNWITNDKIEFLLQLACNLSSTKHGSFLAWGWKSISAISEPKKLQNTSDTEFTEKKSFFLKLATWRKSCQFKVLLYC